MRGASSATLFGYCDRLWEVLQYGRDFSSYSQFSTWLVPENDLKKTIRGYFNQTEYPSSFLDVWVNEVVDDLIGVFPLLAYFKGYLKSHFMDDLSSENFAKAADITLLRQNQKSVMNSVRNLM